jgi:hypothetical protein
MATTSLFVELIAVGVMAASWLLLLFAVLTKQSISKVLETLSGKTILWVPGLVLCYVLGIVLDVLIDRLIFHKFEYTIRAYQIARILNVKDNDRDTRSRVKATIRSNWYRIRIFLWQIPTDDTACEISTYFRHRIRVSRAACINSLLLGLGGCVYVWSQDDDLRTGLAVLGLGGIFAAACAYSWYELTSQYNGSLIRYYFNHFEPAKEPISLGQLIDQKQIEEGNNGPLVQDSTTTQGGAGRSVVQPG